LILLYTPDRKAFIGFIPNDQAAFVDRLRKLIQHQKASTAILRQVKFCQCILDTERSEEAIYFTNMCVFYFYFCVS